mgnify:CR=1 FL=1
MQSQLSDHVWHDEQRALLKKGVWYTYKIGDTPSIYFVDGHLEIEMLPTILTYCDQLIVRANFENDSILLAQLLLKMGWKKKCRIDEKKIFMEKNVNFFRKSHKFFS